MNAISPPTRYPSKPPTRGLDGASMPKSLSENVRLHLTKDEVTTKLVREALRRSFPDSSSDEDIADAASEYWCQLGHIITKRTIRYWLSGDTQPRAKHLLALASMQPSLFIGSILGRGG